MAEAVATKGALGKSAAPWLLSLDALVRDEALAAR